MQVPILGMGGTAKADGGLQISTTYPGITVKAGSTPTFTINVENKTGTSQSFALTSTVPDKWSETFTGAGNPITKVYVADTKDADVAFNVTIPDDTAEGVNNIVVTATGDTGVTSTLNLQLTITKKDVSQGKFTSQFPSQTGSSTTAFKFSTSITNSSGTDQSYVLSSNAPSGWTVTFAPAYQTQQISSASVAAGGNQSIDVSITPAPNTPAGKYVITCTATSSQQDLAFDLTVNVTGSYALTMTTSSGRLNADAYAGQETAVSLVVKNTGTADLADLSLSGSAQASDWAVRFDPATISTLAAGQSANVTAYISVASGSIVGDYEVDLSANASNAAVTTATATTAIRVHVNASTTWGIIAIIIVLLLIAGLIVMFMKFGRR